MTFREYQTQSAQYDTSSKSDWYYTLGLTGEAGEVAEIIKKAYRTVPSMIPVDREKLCLELGDVLWYLTRLATHYKYTLEEIALSNISKLERRKPCNHLMI